MGTLVRVRDVAERLSNAAAIGSPLALPQYGLHILARDIGNVQRNKTRFAVLGAAVEGYHPPSDPRLGRLQVTPDPGVLEVNIHPAHDWSECSAHTLGLYEEARNVGERAVAGYESQNGPLLEWCTVESELGDILISCGDREAASAHSGDAGGLDLGRGHDARFAQCGRGAGTELTPDDELKTFRVEPPLRVELVAAEPLVESPCAMAFDEKGRLFVAENRGYPNTTEPPPTMHSSPMVTPGRMTAPPPMKQRAPMWIGRLSPVSGSRVKSRVLNATRVSSPMTM